MYAPQVITPDENGIWSEWPPNYSDVFAWRIQQLRAMRASPHILKGALAYYAQPEHAAEFIYHWCDTADPRNAGHDGKLVNMPFVFFERQDDMIDCLTGCLRDEEDALFEKSRDMGATWAACGFSVWNWRFRKGSAVGWGSRKEDLVDKIGDMDSIFEKIRFIISHLPPEFLPRYFNFDKHATFMRIVNPQNGATITGESGDNIGRGGRKTIYFKDESAHYERPEKIEASLSENTRVQIDISSVNGTGNPFHRKREAGVIYERGKTNYPKGKTRVFIFDWRDHPEKTQDWYDRNKAKKIDQGLGHIFAQEVDRNYSASVEGIIVQPEWFDAAIDAHKKLMVSRNEGLNIGALDVADGGIDKNAAVRRVGITLREAIEFGSSNTDVGITTVQAIDLFEKFKPIEIQYDSVGVGSTVKAEINRLMKEEPTKSRLRRIAFVPWSAGAKVLMPFNHIIPDDEDTPLNRDYYQNLKAQGWWELRNRFYRTFRAVTMGVKYPLDSLISIDSTIPLLLQLKKEICQPVMTKSVSTLKLVVDKTPDGTKSPNLGDAAMMCYWPIPTDLGQVVSSSTAGEAKKQ